MNEMLSRWNQLSDEEAALEMLDCCGSQTWAWELAHNRPIEDEASLVAASDQIWNRLSVQDWLQAFSKHPRMGERKAPQQVSARSASWSAQEQGNVDAAAQSALLQANREYEQRFGRVFIVCATGKSAQEILEMLHQRLRNDDETELRAAAEEQRNITNIRLNKWLNR
jgi:2-oxo-4-hydroxy-4-carboxy-5-ureidoimidazoline decarboxylase